MPALRDEELIAAARTVIDADGRAVLSAAMALDEGFVAAARRRGSPASTSGGRRSSSMPSPASAAAWAG